MENQIDLTRESDDDERQSTFESDAALARKLSAELHFDFVVENLVVLQDSVLAFHKHGMQGRSFKNNEVTQEIQDRSRIFKLVGSDRWV